MKRGGDRQVAALLELDPELGEDLDEGELRAAREELLVRVEEIDWTRRAGPWGPADPSGLLGFLMADGLIMRDVALARGSSAELLGRGDLLRPWDIDGLEIMPPGSTRVMWIVLRKPTVAVLDLAFVAQACRWPTVLARLAGRGVLRAKAGTLNQAISHLKHVESRLLVLFWHLADRWGRRGPEAIIVDLPLTHQLLAHVVGATRPSVTSALGQLARDGLLVKGPDGAWRLSPSALERIDLAARLPGEGAAAERSAG